MQKVNALELVERALSLLSDKTVSSVLGWKKGEFDYDITPALFTSAEELKENNKRWYDRDKENVDEC